MRRVMIALAAVLIFVLSGCKENEVEVTIIPPQEMTEQEMYEYFQNVLENHGNVDSEASEQVTIELETLETLISDFNKTTPENYKTLYRFWRTTYIEKLKVQIQNEYESIISERPLFDGLNPGLCYVDYIDFDNDRNQELFLITLNEGPTEDNEYAILSAMVEVFGPVRGQVRKYGEATFAWSEIEWDQMHSGTFALYRSGDQICIGDQYTFGGSGGGEDFICYSVQNHTLVLSDHVQWNNSGEGPDGFRRTVYYSVSPATGKDDQERMEEITLETYEAILKKYTKETVIFDHYSVYGIYPAMESYGVLPNLREGHTPIVLLNENKMEFTNEPFLYYDNETPIVVVPAQETLQAIGVALLGYSVEDGDVLSAATKKGTFYLKNLYLKTGETVQPFLSASGEPDSILFIPVTELEKIDGIKITWDPQNWTVQITSKIPDDDKLTAAEVEAMENFTLQEATAIAEKAGYLIYPGYAESYSKDGKKWWIFEIFPLGTREETADYDSVFLRVAHDGTMVEESG